MNGGTEIYSLSDSKVKYTGIPIVQYKDTDESYKRQKSLQIILHRTIYKETQVW